MKNTGYVVTEDEAKKLVERAKTFSAKKNSVLDWIDDILEFYREVKVKNRRETTQAPRKSDFTATG